MYNLTKVMQDEDIRRVAPSVFAEDAWTETSDRYRFLPTINVINALRDNGYNVVMAGQSRSRIPGKGDFTKHILRMRHNDVLAPSNIGEEVPEIVLVNSHDRTSAYKLMLGIFRLVCSNGMIVASSTIESLNIRHSGARDLLSQVIDVSGQVTTEIPAVMGQIERFKGIELNPAEQMALAAGAKELLPTSLIVDPASLLTVRRSADRGNGTNTLWKTSNIIQENVIKGGLRATNAQGQRRHSRGIKCIQNNVNINKALWRLTEELAKIKQG